MCFCSTLVNLHFNPRPHTKGDIGGAQVVHLLTISILAPTQRATDEFQRFIAMLVQFQSSPPHKGRL